MLSILDCCFAGDVHKGSPADTERTYQLISAAAQRKVTSKPGEASFTRALIQSLEALLDERDGKPFTTIQLVNRIEQQEHRKRNPPRLCHRLNRDDRMISLGPIPHRSNERLPVMMDPSKAFLTIRLGLSEEKLSHDHVKNLGKTIAKACKESGAPVRRHDLIAFSQSTRKRTFLQMADYTRVAEKVLRKWPKPSQLRAAARTCRQLATPNSEAETSTVSADASSSAQVDDKINQNMDDESPQHSDDGEPRATDDRVYQEVNDDVDDGDSGEVNDSHRQEFKLGQHPNARKRRASWDVDDGELRGQGRPRRNHETPLIRRIMT